MADLYSKTNNKKLVEVYEKMLEVMGQVAASNSAVQLLTAVQARARQVPRHAEQGDQRECRAPALDGGTCHSCACMCGVLTHLQAQNHLQTLLEVLRGDSSETGVKERLAALHQLLHVRGEGQHAEVARLLLIWARKEFTDVDDTVLIAQVTAVISAPASESRDKARDASVKKEIDIGEENRRARSEQIRSAVSERRYECVNDILTRDFAQVRGDLLIRKYLRTY